jgi:hypothetical protein
VQMTLRTVSAFAAALAIGLACLVVWRHTPNHHIYANPASVAYRAGYGGLYKGPPGKPRTTTVQNIYLRTPRSDWRDTAYERITHSVDEIEQDCDPFTPVGRRALLALLPEGDWQDYVAGREQALQDIAAGTPARSTTPPGFHGIDCD